MLTSHQYPRRYLSLTVMLCSGHTYWKKKMPKEDTIIWFLAMGQYWHKQYVFTFSEYRFTLKKIKGPDKERGQEKQSVCRRVTLKADTESNEGPLHCLTLPGWTRLLPLGLEVQKGKEWDISFGYFSLTFCRGWITLIITQYLIVNWYTISTSWVWSQCRH